MGLSRAIERAAMKMLEMRNVSKQRQEGSGYKLKIVNFELGEKENVAITGPSGCGKSTTLDMIGMILDPDQADLFQFISPNGKTDVAALWREGKSGALTDFRRRNLGYVLQTGELFSFLNVQENIELTARAAGVNPEAVISRAKELMDRLEIAHLRKKYPGTLSIGERQRVAIARAIAPQPRLLLADEPTAALDPLLSRKVMALFLDVVKDYGTTVILVSHDINLVREFNFSEAPICVQRHGDSITATLDRVKND